MIIGPSAAGLLGAAGLLHEAMLIDALTLLVSLASLAGVRRHYGPAGTAGRKAVAWRALGRELAEGIRYLAATRLLLTLLVFILTLNLCLGADKLILFLGALAGLLGNNPRPVIAAAGCLTLLTVAVAWFAGLAKENASGIAVGLLGK
jgi:hypothetical protein